MWRVILMWYFGGDDGVYWRTRIVGYREGYGFCRVGVGVGVWEDFFCLVYWVFSWVRRDSYILFNVGKVFVFY